MTMHEEKVEAWMISMFHVLLAMQTERVDDWLKAQCVCGSNNLAPRETFWRSLRLQSLQKV